MENVSDPVTAAALSSVVTAFLLWVSGKGWPVIKDAMGLMSDREKQVREQAKEGPIMVLEEVKRQLEAAEVRALKLESENARQLAEVLIELKEIRKQHHDCETKYAGLQAEVQFLRRDLADLKNNT